MPGWNALNAQVLEWGRTRGIVPCDPDRQALKLVSEVGELCDAVAKGDHAGIVDGIGDSVTVLVILAHFYGMTLEECLERAYNEIKSRKGNTVNGVFIKESEDGRPA